MRITLFVSLALNLLVAGLVGGVALSFRGGGDGPPVARLVRDLGLGPFLRALSDNDRRALGAAAESRRTDLRKHRQEMRATFTETLAALRDEPFDPQRLASVIGRQSEIANRSRGLGQELLVARIAAMAPAERLALADRLERKVRRGGGHRGP